MEGLQKDSKKYETIILWQQNSRDYVKKSETMKSDKLGQENKTTSHWSNLT